MPFIIDVDPVAFTLLGLQVRWYGLVLVAAIAVAAFVALQEARRRGIASEVVWDGSLWVGLAAIVGGRLLYVAQNGLGDIASHPAHILMVWTGGLSFYGGLLVGLLALVLFARRRHVSVLTAIDVAALSAAIGQAIGHAGCLIGGDSYGIPTTLPWAVVYRNPGSMAPLGVPLQPTQGYEGILLGALFVGLWLGRRRLQAMGDGVLASAYLVGLAGIRFGLFFLRDEAPVLLGLRTAQWIGLAIAVMGVAVFLVARRRGHGVSLPSISLEAASS